MRPATIVRYSVALTTPQGAPLETFKEFTFEAAHCSLPFEGLHGHSFKVRIVLRGEAHPEYGWSHNLYDVDKHVGEVRAMVHNRLLNDVEGLEFPSLENTTRWLYQQLSARIDGLAEVTLSRGRDGDSEGCRYSGPVRRMPNFAQALTTTPYLATERV